MDIKDSLKKANEIAAKQLNVPKDWEIAYSAISFEFVTDSGEITDHLDGGRSTADEVDEAYYEAANEVMIPAGFRLVGMRKKDGDKSSPRVFGIVDLSSSGYK